MIDALLVLHLMVTLALIGVVLIQRSEGGGLGIGSSQGMGAFMSGRGTANLLTRSTAILAAIFMALSLILAIMNRGTAGAGRDILDAPRIPDHHAATSNLAAHPGTRPATTAPATGGASSLPATPSEAPAAPTVPTH